jgi:hypothetical protein
MIFELRQYHIRRGQQAKWVKCMEEEIIPFQVKMHGHPRQLRRRRG